MGIKKVREQDCNKRVLETILKARKRGNDFGSYGYGVDGRFVMNRARERQEGGLTC